MAADGTKAAILASLLEQARHFGGLREYGYDVTMPLLLNPPESPLACRETPDEFKATNSSFSAQIHALFEALHDFERQSTSTDGDALIRTDGLQPVIRIANQSFDIYPSCLHRSFHSRRLFIRDDDGDGDDQRHPLTSLPQLSRVTALQMHPAPNPSHDIAAETARPVAAHLPLLLATRCPNIRALDCTWLWERLPEAFKLPSVRHFTRPWEGPWRDARHDFGRVARALAAQGGEEWPASLRSARLWFFQPSAFYLEGDQGTPMPDLVRPESADPLSLGLRALASRLEVFDVRAFVTPDLFRAPVAWARMERLSVEFHPWCPDGTWYFAGPGDDGDGAEPESGFEVTAEEHYPPEGPNELDEEMDETYLDDEGTDEEAESATDMFRTEPLSSKIEPLLMAFAEALRDGMPALDEAELFTYLAWKPSEERRDRYEGADEAPFNMDHAIYRWGVSYVPGKDGGKGAVTWQVGSWRPQESVTRAFEALGGENADVDTIWKPFEFLEQRRNSDRTAFQ